MERENLPAGHDSPAARHARGTAERATARIFPYSANPRSMPRSVPPRGDSESPLGSTAFQREANAGKHRQSSASALVADPKRPGRIQGLTPPRSTLSRGAEVELLETSLMDGSAGSMAARPDGADDQHNHPQPSATAPVDRQPGSPGALPSLYADAELELNFPRSTAARPDDTDELKHEPP